MPSLSPTLTTVSLKFDKTTLLLPATKKTTISQLKKVVLEALNSTKSSPSGEPLDKSSFEIYRSSKHASNSGNILTGHSKGLQNSWELLSNDHSTMSDLLIEEAETLGIGFKNSKGSIDPPVIEIWKENEVDESLEQE